MKGTAMEIYRSEEFVLRNSRPFRQGEDSKCGPVPSYKFRFEVWLKGQNVKPTGKEFFILENGLIGRYFKRAYSTTDEKEWISCERMAQLACQHFESLCTGEYKKVGIDEILVRIWGSPISYVQAHVSINGKS